MIWKFWIALTAPQHKPARHGTRSSTPPSSRNARRQRKPKQPTRPFLPTSCPGRNTPDLLTNRAADDLPEHFKEPDEAIAQFLIQFEGVRQLTLRDLAEYNHGFRAGWEIPDLSTDLARKLRVLLPLSPLTL